MMPRLSLYQRERTNDYRFIDRNIYEMFQVGGLELLVHKYIGPVDPSDPSKALGETTIQDVIFLENRDRRYDTDIYSIRCQYQVQDVDFNLTQFGLFLQNDILHITVHMNNSVETVGRKLMSGDVVEFPNNSDIYALNDHEAMLKRYYVIDEITFAAEGYSPTWRPHLYRIKVKPVTDSQEFADILERPVDPDVYAGIYSPGTVYYPGQVVRHDGILYVVKDDGTIGNDGTTLSPPNPSAWDLYSDSTVKDLMSTYDLEMELNQAVIDLAELDAAKSGHDISHFYTLAVDPVTGVPLIQPSTPGSRPFTPTKDGYHGYMLGDGLPPNGAPFGTGVAFPAGASEGDFYLRIDSCPNRLFRFNGSRWVKYEDAVQLTLTNTDDRNTQKGTFINNNEMSGIRKVAGDVVVVKATTIEFTPGSTTTAATRTATDITILTNVLYRSDYKVEIWIGEQGVATNITQFQTGQYLSFTIEHAIPANTRIGYNIYDRLVPQRQPVSSALKRIKPVADN